jgi:hypothetical protein
VVVVQELQPQQLEQEQPAQQIQVVEQVVVGVLLQVLELLAALE